MIELLSNAALKKGYMKMMPLEKQEYERRLKLLFFNLMRGVFYLRITRPRLERFCNKTEDKPILSMVSSKSLSILHSKNITNAILYKLSFASTYLYGKIFTFILLLPKFNICMFVRFTKSISNSFFFSFFFWAFSFYWKPKMLFTTKIQLFVLLLISFILVYYLLPTHHNTTTAYNFTNLNRPSGDRVLILTPFKQSAHLIDRYFDNLERLTYPHHFVSVGLLVSDSTDGTLDKIQARVDKQLPFEEITVMQRDFHYDLPNNEDRHHFDVQVQRRAIMAKSRNTLLATALSSRHDWVLWLDGDVTEYPETILEELIAVNKDVVAPNCWWHSYNEEGGYDKNNWQETPESLEFKKSLSEDDVLVEGKD
jgi:mannan polymerase complexes MNN9 subunit